MKPATINRILEEAQIEDELQLKAYWYSICYDRLKENPWTVTGISFSACVGKTKLAALRAARKRARP